MRPNFKLSKGKGNIQHWCEVRKLGPGTALRPLGLMPHSLATSVPFDPVILCSAPRLRKEVELCRKIPARIVTAASCVMESTQIHRSVVIK
jgi:hypothetical protein